MISSKTKNKENQYKSHRKWVQNNIEKYRTYHKEYNSREEVKKRRRELYRKNIEHYKKRDKEHYYKTEDRHRELWASKKYKISIEEYRELYQKETCDICDQKEIAIGRNGNIKRLAIDHSHQTGKVRGLLCQRCNQATGLLRENIDLIERVIKYLNGKNKTS
jgi:hypothetical protein